MSPEIEAELPREVVAPEGRSETREDSVEPAVTTVGRGAASGMWAIGDPFADDGFADDGNSIFPADDRGPACGRYSVVGETSSPAAAVGLSSDIRDVETHGIASHGGQTMNARNDDASPGIG